MFSIATAVSAGAAIARSAKKRHSLRHFELAPVEVEVNAKTAPHRVFELEAPSAEAKAKWVRALRGKRADGRHRADSPDFAPLYATVAASLGGGDSLGGGGASRLAASGIRRQTELI